MKWSTRQDNSSFISILSQIEENRKKKVNNMIKVGSEVVVVSAYLLDGLEGIVKSMDSNVAWIEYEDNGSKKMLAVILSDLKLKG